MTETDLLVIVPHEDDELAIAGAMIYGAVQQKMNIKVVFVTNGDYYRHEGIIRIREAEGMHWGNLVLRRKILSF